jgi:predicted transport protein
MPLFQRDKQKLTLIKPKKFTNEKELQHLIELNLKEIFNCSFVASEFSTGPAHGGRIDTLALSEENNPVIIEYKVVESSQLVNQSLYYLSWMNDHRGDFEIAVQKTFPDKSVEVDWTDIRVICIAPEYKKYDLHAVQMMGSNIELWQYRYFDNGVLFFEEVYRKSISITVTNGNFAGKNPVMVEAGKKAALSRKTGVYTLEQHIDKIDEGKKFLVEELRDYILGVDESVEEVPKKYYIAYKVSQNFACMNIQKDKIKLLLKVESLTLGKISDNCREGSQAHYGHYGACDFEINIRTQEDIENAKEYIQLAFNNIGGN